MTVPRATAFPLRRWPKVETAIKTAISEAERAGDGYPLACRHVLIGGPALWRRSGAILCVAHPADGLRDESCHNSHVQDQHDDEHEHTCDGCHAIVERITPVAVPAGLATTVRDLTGRARTVVGPFFIGGLGLCRRCRTAEGPQR